VARRDCPFGRWNWLLSTAANRNMPESATARSGSGESNAMKRAFTLLPLILALPFLAHAQAGAGYTKIASTNGLSQIDTSVTDGAVYEYQITSFCAQPVAPATAGPCGLNALGGPVIGESMPLVSNPADIPNDGKAHTVTLNWVASLTPGAIYNVYRIEATGPAPPSASTTGPVATVN